MSHAGPPPPDDPAPEQPAYNPYPDNWDRPATGNQRFEAAAPPPHPAQPPGTQPYGAPSYGGPTNPYAGNNPRRPTFGFGGFAGWLTRVGASLIDSLLAAIVAIPSTIGFVMFFGDTTTTTRADGTQDVQFHNTAFPVAMMIIGTLLSLGFTIWNVYIRQGLTGATIGKSILAIRLVNSDFQPIGPGWAFLRQVLHIVDALPCYLGYLNPIWDSQKQTFADKIMNTYVINATAEVERPF
jgi:uncharacterized RDD family membrane protein YckC